MLLCLVSLLLIFVPDGVSQCLSLRCTDFVDFAVSFFTAYSFTESFGLGPDFSTGEGLYLYFDRRGELSYVVHLHMDCRPDFNFHYLPFLLILNRLHLRMRIHVLESTHWILSNLSKYLMRVRVQNNHLNYN